MLNHLEMNRKVSTVYMYVKCSQPATQAEFTCRIGYQSQIIITLSGVEWGDVVEKEKKMEKNSFFLLQTYLCKI